MPALVFPSRELSILRVKTPGRPSMLAAEPMVIFSLEQKTKQRQGSRRRCREPLRSHRRGIYQRRDAGPRGEAPGHGRGAHRGVRCSAQVSPGVGRHHGNFARRSSLGVFPRECRPIGFTDVVVTDPPSIITGNTYSMPNYVSRPAKISS